MDTREFSTESYEGQMLAAAMVILATEFMKDNTMQEVMDKIELTRKDMGYQTLQDRIIQSVEETFQTKFTFDDTGIPMWCPPNCPTKPQEPEQ